MMAIRPVFLALTAAILIGSPSRAQAPAELVRRAVQAVGGEAALRSLTGTVAEFNSSSFGLGQEETPLSPPRGPIAFGRTVTDFGAGRRSLEQELRQVTGVVVRQRRVTAGGIGMTEANGVATADAPVATGQVLQGIRLQPEQLLARAAGARLTALTPKAWRGDLLPGVRFTTDRDTIAMYFDRASGLPVVTETVTDDPILGDRRTVTWYTRWQDAGGGLLLPRQLDVEVNGRLQSQTYFTTIRANPPIGDSLFAIPDSIAARARALPGGSAVAVSLVELAPGVWRAEGGSHHSLVVDQGSSLVVVEAPQSTRRFQAVLDTLRRRFPTKRVSEVVSTHHHWDHTGGIRAALAAGLPVTTHRRNVEFVRSIGTAPKTVAPDALSRQRRVPSVRPVDDSLAVGAGAGRIVLYRLPTVHAEGVLAAYHPSSRILFTSDVVSPTTTASIPALGASELIAAARTRGLTVDRYAGGHGVVVGWADLERAAAGR
jgi:glyoxylase-like metal-dependent hydrolase (beta-lactamase superfamily II)